MNKNDLLHPKNFQPIIRDGKKIKIGHRLVLKSGKIIPSRVDEFLIRLPDRKSGNYITDPKIELKDKRKVPVYFLSDDPEDIFYLYRGRWSKDNEGRVILFCKDIGLGKALIYGSEEAIECNPDSCKYWNNGRCDWHGVLSCQLVDDPVIGAYARFRTGGFNTIRNIPAALKQLSVLTGGHLAGIRFSLHYYTEYVVDKTGENRQIPIINVEYEGTYLELLEEANKIQRLKERLGIELVSYQGDPGLSKVILINEGDEEEAGIIASEPADKEPELAEEPEPAPKIVNETRLDTEKTLEAYAKYLLDLSPKVTDSESIYRQIIGRYDSLDQMVKAIRDKYSKEDRNYLELSEFLAKNTETNDNDAEEEFSAWDEEVFK